MLAIIGIIMIELACLAMGINGTVTRLTIAAIVGLALNQFPAFKFLGDKK